MNSESALRSANGTLEGERSTCCRSIALLAFVLLSGSFSLANAQGWNGSGPFPSNANSNSVHALAIDPVNGTVYAGTASGTVFALADATVSQPPEAFDDAAVTQPGLAIAVDVLANDVDPEDALEVTSVTLQAVPTNGTAIANSDGSMTYTPNAGGVGHDTFTYTVRDAAGNTSNAATVTVRVNGPPTAADDTAATLENEPVTVDVLANDADADGSLDPATVAVADPPANGSAIEEADGRITYAPAVDFTGADTFSYRVGDDDGAVSNVATVTVTVTANEPPNTPPVANDDAATVTEGGSVTIPVLANDNDADGTLVAATLALQGAPGNGSAQAGGGSIVYTPAAGFIGTHSCTWTSADDDAATSTAATVTVTVTAAGGGNSAPVAADDTASTEEGVPVDVDVLANDSDADGTLDAATVALQNAPGNGTAEVNADGTVTYTPDAGFSGTDTFSYTVQDDAGAGSDPATVTVTVIAAADPPAPPPGGGGSGDDGGNRGGGGGASGLLWLATLALVLLRRAWRAGIGHVRLEQGTPEDEMKSRECSVVGTLIVLSVLGTGSAAAAPYVYVTQYADNSVAVIDAATNSIVDTIPMPARPAGIALSPDGRLAYVANSGASSVSVIDTATNNVVSTIPGVPYPLSIVVTADGTRAYTGAHLAAEGQNITVIDLVAGSASPLHSYAEDIIPGLAILPDGSRLYAASSYRAAVVSIDTDPGSVAASSIPHHPPGPVWDVLVAPDATRAYASLQSSSGGWIVVVDTATNSQVAQISVGSEPRGLAAAADGSRIYVANNGSGTVSVIDTATNEVIGEPIAVGSQPGQLAVTPAGGRLYVANFGDDTVSVIDLAAHSVIATIPVGNEPHEIVIGPVPAIAALVIDPANSLTVYAGTAGDGVYRTLDGGASWTRSSAGIADLRITALVIATDGSALYAGTRTSGVFKSSDGGASWNAVNNGLDPRIAALQIAAGDGMTLYAGIDGGGGVYKTTDGGATWTAVNGGLPAGTP